MSEPFIIHGGQVYLSGATIIESSIQNAKVKDEPDQDVSKILERFVEIIRSTDLGQELIGAPQEKGSDEQLKEAWVEGAKRAYEAVFQDLQSQCLIGASAHRVNVRETEAGIPYAAGFVVESAFPKSEGEKILEQQESRIQELELRYRDLLAEMAQKTAADYKLQQRISDLELAIRR